MTSSLQSQLITKGIHFRHDPSGAWAIEVDSIDALVDALGSKLLIAFVRCFGALDKVMTILDCMAVVLPPEDAPHAETPRAKRNAIMLTNFITAHVFELREGIRDLRDAGIEARLSPNAKGWWNALVHYAHPKHERASREIRNCLAFHLGDARVIKRGIDRVREDGRGLTLIEAEGPARVHAFRPMVTDLLLAGMRLPTDAGVAHARAVKAATDERRSPPPEPVEPLSVEMTWEDFSNATTEAKGGHNAAANALERIFMDLLRQAGAGLEMVEPYTTESAEHD